MSVITGKVLEIEIDVQVKKQGGGTYPGWSLAYKTLDGEARSISKHMNGLKYNAALKNGLEELKPGDEFTLVSEKKDGFLNPKTIFKGIKEVQENEDKSTNSVQQAPKVNNAAPNTFEVSNILKEKQMKLDEIKQPIIIRQVCLKAATELSELFKHKTEADVIAQADRFVRYIEFGSIEDMPNDDIEVN